MLGFDVSTNDLSLDETGISRTGASQRCLPFSVITGKRLPRWTSSRFRRHLQRIYCFFVISHDRRRILHFNVTKHPTSLWIVQQLREAFPFESAPGSSSMIVMPSMDWKSPSGSIPDGESVRTSFESPWQNGVAERWIGVAGVISWITSSQLTKRTRNAAWSIFATTRDRTHLGLGKGTPDRKRNHSIASGSRPFSCRTGRAAPPVRLGLPNPNQRRRENVRFVHPYISVYRAGVLRERFLALENEGII